MLSLIFQALFGLVVLFFLIYAVLELRLVMLSRRSERVRMMTLDADQQCSLGSAVAWPKVTVLLPVYNESRVIESLIDAACALEYPAEQLQILVLDDSRDQTTILAAAKVQIYARQGINISVIKRKDRKGYKAGNLANGLQYATGEFLALFDADFVPPKDFLYQTIPCFSDPEIGYLQTGIDYANRNASFLTRFQAMMMGHQQFVTTGLSYEKLMGALSGSSCVWRSTCVDSLGGWCGGTVAEDADIGYRAQFSRWRYAYLRHVVSLSELAESMDAIRVQRHRWAHGLIHNAFKHMKSFFASRMTIVERLHAMSLIFSSVLLASIYVLVVLSLPLAMMADHLGFMFDAIAYVFAGGAVLWGFANFVGSSQTQGDEPQAGVLDRLVMMFAYVSMFFPLSLYYFVAAVQLVFEREYEFKRTPKAGEQTLDALNHLFYRLEWVSLIYTLIAFGVAWHYSNYWLVLFDTFVITGFSIVIYFQIKQRRLAVS
ncbi:glycosyltransferase [Fluviibacter phosphoraccumulans]|uniref:Glucosyltransferase n=1 Tax=Fluviibacter phosphoraccumulans TaxID=1751046 RepID=A0A7R6QY66_9RHOO|nr:glycosyltransferase [Fluviibacter phosphoraccumulans]BBU69612.1 glucosyltransferase [Fluviibacter phosphoraccumulans]BBU71205.1 glucosyltransferase [Fluviibacter phosphoraccumulans]